METLKLLSFAFAISLSTVSYAEKTEKIYDLNALSAQIELLLRDSQHPMDEGETVTLFFSISEDKAIQFLNVASTNKRVGELLEKKLQHQKLDGEKWREGKIYELTIQDRRSSQSSFFH